MVYDLIIPDSVFVTYAMPVVTALVEQEFSEQEVTVTARLENADIMTVPVDIGEATELL